MTPPRFIQLSTLTTFPASLLNRDDSGLAKRMPFGPCTRTRVSSQCLKRHWRMAEDAFALNRIADGLERSVRSKRVFSEFVEKPLIEEGMDRDRVIEASAALQKELYGGKDKAPKPDKKKKNEESEGWDTARNEVVVLGEPEIRFLRDAARELAGVSDKDAVKNWWKEHRDEFLALRYGAGVDAAMFGRFVSGDAGARVSSAVHVAHAFTIHEEASETDYFTAVDDLQDLGSGHINATELTSGIFYCYVVIDVPQLVSNLTGCPSKDWLRADRSVAASVVRNFTHLMCTVSPGAKLGSTAPYAHAWFVLAECGDSQPRTLADAFLNPVPAREDMRREAVRALSEFVRDYDEMYGAVAERYAACLPQIKDVVVPGAERLSVADLADVLAQRIVGAGA